MFLSTAPSLPSSLYISSSCSPLCFLFFFFFFCTPSDLFLFLIQTASLPLQFLYIPAFVYAFFFSFTVFALWSPFYLKKKKQTKPRLLSFSPPPTPIMFSFSSLPLISPTSPPLNPSLLFFFSSQPFFLLVYMLSQSRPFSLPPFLPSSPFATADQGTIYIQHHGQLPTRRKHRAAVTPVGQR